MKSNRHARYSVRPAGEMKLNVFTNEQQLEFWVTSFATSHIGMSAIRDRIIDGCGNLASGANLINRGIKLPSYWPGDDVGKDEVFPDEDTAGRQIYRIGYTMVSFTTLGGALAAYLSIQGSSGVDSTMILTEQEHMACFAIASLSQAASIASLFNASPLSLMPGFQQAESDGNGSVVSAGGANGQATIAGLQRNDSLKFEPKGLTRITRHPLILPVVPWGISTSYLAGGRFSDFILFGGLAVYALAGCACQDLRIIRKEGSVGTVFRPSSSEVGMKLDSFFANTSFVPFAAVLDGRQSMGGVLREFPLFPFIVGIPIGMLIEDTLLQWLHQL